MKMLFKLSGLAIVVASTIWTSVSCNLGNSDEAKPDPSSKTITAFSIVNPGSTGTINEGAKTITVTVPYGTNVTALVAEFTTTGASVKVQGVNQTSGITANDFTNTVDYVVTAADLSTATYQVTVAVASASLVRIIYLHHSTGGIIWDGGVPEAVAAYNTSHGTQYTITEMSYPNTPYPWANYPYDYWNLWVANTGASMAQEQSNLDMLSEDYDVIVFKHCFPVSGIGPDTGAASVSSAVKSLENYYLQYEALKTRFLAFPDRKFIVWTGAALRQADTSAEQATRAKTFFDWVVNNWDEPGDNIFVWDFFNLETEGGMYLTTANASTDSHPNSTFAQEVAPYFVNRLVDVIEGRGDTGSITGK